MKKEKYEITTKDDIVKNFNQKELEVYNYYKSKLSYQGKELVPVYKEDKEIAFLENGYSFLKVAFKVEAVVALMIVTFAFVFDFSPKAFTTVNNSDKISYEQQILKNPNK